MSWRTLVISNRCKLDYKMGYMEIRGEDTKRVFLDEIALVIIENTAVSLTCCLLEEMVKAKIRVIFCDGKATPNAELVPYYGSHDCSKKIKLQSLWNDTIKSIIWSDIVAEKIKKQADFLFEIGKIKESKLLSEYINQIEINDATNREGHAAKVYFNGVFGMQFTRSDENAINAALNYGYSIILAAFNREVVSNGYLTQIGLFHDNVFNHFNLSCDLMEPFRIIIDRKVYESLPFSSLDTRLKRVLIDLLNKTVFINQTKQTVLNAIKLYTRSIFDALSNMDPSLICYYDII